MGAALLNAPQRSQRGENGPVRAGWFRNLWGRQAAWACAGMQGDPGKEPWMLNERLAEEGYIRRPGGDARVTASSKSATFASHERGALLLPIP